MIHVLDFIIRWTIYPIMFVIFLTIDYLFNLIFWFELPEIDIRAQFKRDPKYSTFSMGEAAYMMSWIVIAVAVFLFILSKLFHY